jgi:hypothetical protein
MPVRAFYHLLLVSRVPLPRRDVSSKHWRRAPSQHTVHNMTGRAKQSCELTLSANF